MPGQGLKTQIWQLCDSCLIRDLFSYLNIMTLTLTLSQAASQRPPTCWDEIVYKT